MRTTQSISTQQEMLRTFPPAPFATPYEPNPPAVHPPESSSFPTHELESLTENFHGEHVTPTRVSVGSLRKFTWKNTPTAIPHSFTALYLLVVQKSARVKKWYDVCYVHPNINHATVNDIIVPRSLMTTTPNTCSTVHSGNVYTPTSCEESQGFVIVPDVKSHMSVKFLRKNTTPVAELPLCLTQVVHASGKEVPQFFLEKVEKLGCQCGFHVFNSRHFLGRERAKWKQELSAVAALIK